MKRKFKLKEREIYNPPVHIRFCVLVYDINKHFVYFTRSGGRLGKKKKGSFSFVEPYILVSMCNSKVLHLSALSSRRISYLSTMAVRLEGCI